MINLDLIRSQMAGPLHHISSLQCRHNGPDSVSSHQPYDCLLNCLFRRRSKKTSNLRVTGLCEGNSPVTSEFPTRRASSAENVFIWWRHHVTIRCTNTCSSYCRFDAQTHTCITVSRIIIFQVVSCECQGLIQDLKLGVAQMDWKILKTGVGGMGVVYIYKIRLHFL